MIDRKFIIAILVIVGVVIAPLVGVNLLYADDIVFDPADFLNQYLDFMVALVSMGISFWLANLYWANKIEQDKISRARRVMARFFRHLQDIVAQCEELLEKDYSDTRESQKRDDKVLQLFPLMMLAKEGLMAHYPEEEVEQDDQLTKSMVDLFWTNVAPAIRDLSMRQTLRGDIDEVYEQLDVIKVSAGQALELLNSRKSTQ